MLQVSKNAVRAAALYVYADYNGLHFGFQILIGQIMRWYSVSTETARLNSLAESVSSSLVENFREGNTGTELNQDLAELAQLEHYNINITDRYELVIADVAGIEGADTDAGGAAASRAWPQFWQARWQGLPISQVDRFTAWITVET